MRDRTIPIALAIVLASASLTTTTRADSADPPTKENLSEAQRRFQRGRELYEENDFRGALVELRRAYDMVPNFRLLYDIAQVYYQLQDYPGALRTFNKYLADGRGEIDPKRRDEVQKEIDRLRPRVASVTIIASKPNAEIAIDDVPIGKAPLREPVLVSIGRRKVSAALSGHVPATKFVDVAGMDTVYVTLDLVPTERPGASPAPDKATTSGPAPPPRRGFPWVPWAITGALGVASGVTGVLALRSSAALDSKLTTFGVTRTELDDARSETKNLALATDILLGATVVAAGTSLVLTLSRGSAKSETVAPPRSALQLSIGPGSAGVSGAF